MPLGNRRLALQRLLLEVVPGAERAAGAAHDDDADLVVGLGAIHRRLELVDERVRHRVELVGAVERDPRGRAAALVEDEVVGHGWSVIGTRQRGATTLRSHGSSWSNRKRFVSNRSIMKA